MGERVAVAAEHEGEGDGEGEPHDKHTLGHVAEAGRALVADGGDVEAHAHRAEVEGLEDDARSALVARALGERPDRGEPGRNGPRVLGRARVKHAVPPPVLGRHVDLDLDPVRVLGEHAQRGHQVVEKRLVPLDLERAGHPPALVVKDAHGLGEVDHLFFSHGLGKRVARPGVVCLVLIGQHGGPHVDPPGERVPRSVQCLAEPREREHPGRRPDPLHVRGEHARVPACCGGDQIGHHQLGRDDGGVWPKRGLADHGDLVGDSVGGVRGGHEVALHEHPAIGGAKDVEHIGPHLKKGSNAVQGGDPKHSPGPGQGVHAVHDEGEFERCAKDVRLEAGVAFGKDVVVWGGDGGDQAGRGQAVKALPGEFTPADFGASVLDAVLEDGDVVACVLEDGSDGAQTAGTLVADADKGVDGLEDVPLWGASQDLVCHCGGEGSDGRSRGADHGARDVVVACSVGDRLCKVCHKGARVCQIPVVDALGGTSGGQVVPAVALAVGPRGVDDQAALPCQVSDLRREGGCRVGGVENGGGEGDVAGGKMRRPQRFDVSHGNIGEGRRTPRVALPGVGRASRSPDKPNAFCV